MLAVVFVLTSGDEVASDSGVMWIRDVKLLTTSREFIRTT